MFVLGNLLVAIARLVDWVLWAYMWILIIRALISWVNPDPWNPIVQFLVRVTEPVLDPIRRRLPMTGIDFSPMIAILLIFFLQAFVVRSLLDLAVRLG
jgi:YggT family protein